MSAVAILSAPRSVGRSIGLTHYRPGPVPKLWHQCTDEEREERRFDTALARTRYNYTRSYLAPLPFSADVPKGEEFSAYYVALVVEPIFEVVENLKTAVVERLEMEIASDLQVADLRPWLGELKSRLVHLEGNLDEMSRGSVFGMVGDVRAVAGSLREVVETITQAPVHQALTNVGRLPGDLRRIVTGFERLIDETEDKDLLTTFLQDTMFNLLRTGKDGAFLRPKSFADYEEYFTSIAPPEMLSIEPQPWMARGERSGLAPWQQDWFFGYSQIAGYNTTQLRRVCVDGLDDHPEALLLEQLLDKMPLSDTVFAQVIGERGATLTDAAERSRLYAVDLAQLDGVEGDKFHGAQRYVTAPIALFYWHDSPKGAYPDGGAMLPVAIQLGQRHDDAETPVFTPFGVGHDELAEDDEGRKWQLAKFYFNNALAIQHETVAHLGDAHLTIEPMVVATHRALPEAHPLYALLWPHFRFTLAINNSAFHSLVVPGGVVASVLGTSIEGSMEMVRQAHLNWRFDEHRPDNVFKRRGVSTQALPDFPFRDDTLLLWKAIRNFVEGYLGLYYADDGDVVEDEELQNWIAELTSEEGAAVKGMSGLVVGDGGLRIRTFDYLCDVVAMIVYTASARHASVNYAQFPLMAFPPSVSGGAYQPPPGRDDVVDESRVLDTLPPIDVALYQASFSYLLSSIQYDKLGHYCQNDRRPYFQDKRVSPLVAAFQAELAEAEAEIHRRNQGRPLPYECQIPSRVPNSISI